MTELDKRGEQTIAIPHEWLSTFKFSPFRRFFFLSTYGNMSTHTDADKILKANVHDLRDVLMGIQDCETFIYLSSSSVNLPVQTIYSRAKVAAEEIIKASKVPHCIIRPFSCIGVGEQKEHLIPTLIRSCMEGTQMDFVPSATHDYVDVQDVCDGLIVMADNKTQGTYEFGTCIPRTNDEVRILVEQATGKKASIKVVEKMRSYDNQEWACCDSRAWERGWHPKKTLEQSILEMVSAYVK